jgi:predicted RNA-binding protein YlxR (DUF448 family)
MSRHGGPMRTCVGCRTVRPRGALVRLVRGVDGRARVSPTGAGRGAYVCPDAACVGRLVRTGSLGRAFKTSCVVGDGLAEAVLSREPTPGR